MQTLRSVLIVDDDALLLRALERDLVSRGLIVYTAASADDALVIARKRAPDCAVVDLMLGEASGIDLLRALKAARPSVVVVLLSGHGAVQSVVDSFHGGAIDFLQKPISGARLFEAMVEAVARAQVTTGVPSLARAQHDHITRVLDECGGNISEAARRLGIHRRSLQRKLHKARPD